MSTTPRLSLIGMYNFDSTLFDNLELPSAFDKQTFTDALLLEHGEKCVMYTDADFMRFSIGVWARKWKDSLARIAAALTEEYNPLHNYDRYEHIEDSDNKTLNLTRKDSGTDTVTEGGTTRTGNSGTDTSRTSNMTTENTVSAFNDSGYQPNDKSVVNGSVATDYGLTSTVTHGKSDTTTYGKTQTEGGTDNRSYTHDAHMYGNIGVTTSVQMLLQEIDARQNHNMYDIATTIFANELLLMVY